MIFLYNEHEGEMLKAWATPFAEQEIVDYLQEAPPEAFVFCDDERHGRYGCDLLKPNSDILPVCNSIILPNGQQWDAHNKKWMSLFEAPFNRNRESFEREWHEQMWLLSKRV